MQSGGELVLSFGRALLDVTTSRTICKLQLFCGTKNIPRHRLRTSLTKLEKTLARNYTEVLSSRLLTAAAI